MISTPVSVTLARSDKAEPAAAKLKGSAHDDEKCRAIVDIYIYAGHEGNVRAGPGWRLLRRLRYPARQEAVNVLCGSRRRAANAVTDVHEPRGDNKGVDIRQAPAGQIRGVFGAV